MQLTLTARNAALRYTRNLILVSWLILALPLSASAQEVAGRVISTVGEVVALRPEDSERVLGRGDEVYVGDRLITAENGRAQIRFIDDGLVDLRPDSAFEVVEYQEADDQQSGSAAMEFTVGALRTITGRIGNRPDDEYDMSTDVASIGIRGTDYSLQLCDFDCAQNGQPEGLYGRVDDGVVAITNQAGTTEFSQNQYFYVENEDLMPQLLPSPPQNILDGSEDGETAEETTDDDAEEDDEATALALSDDDTEEGDEDADAEAAFGGLADVDTEFEIGEDSLDTEQESDPEPEPDPEPEIEPVTRATAGHFVNPGYAGHFFGGMVRETESTNDQLSINNDLSAVTHIEFPDGGFITVDGEDVREVGNFGDLAYWGSWYYDNDFEGETPTGDALGTADPGFHFVYSENITQPDQLSNIEGTIDYSLLHAFDARTGEHTWTVDKLDLVVNFTDIEVDEFDLEMAAHNNLGMTAHETDISIESFMELDFEFDARLTGEGGDPSATVLGEFNGQIVGETAQGVIFSLDIDRYDDGVVIEDLITSGFLVEPH